MLNKNGRPSWELSNVAAGSLCEMLGAESEKIKPIIAAYKNPWVGDIGCGSGRATAEARKWNPEARFAGIDNDPRAVREYNRRFRSHKNVKAYNRDIRETGLPEESFDIEMLTYCVLGNLEGYKEQALTEMNRILKPSGKLVASVYSKNAKEAQHATYRKAGIRFVEAGNDTALIEDKIFSHRFSRDELSSLFDRCSFKAKIEPLTDIAYFVVAEKA